MNLKKTRSNNPKVNNVADRLTTVLFIIYLIALHWILLFKLGVRFSYMEDRRVNLIPFGEAFISNGKMDAGEIISNVVIFIPLGIYTGVLFRRWTWGSKLCFFFLVSLIFEGIQFILRIGAFDITDIISNTFGGIIGLMIFEAIEKVFKNSIWSQKFINIIAAIGTVLIISLLFLLKMNMLPVRYQ